MSKAITTALRQLAEAREGLLAVGDEIWASISPRDAQARREGVAFYDSYSDKVATLDALAAEITNMLEQYVASQAPQEQPAPEPAPDGSYRLDAQFTFKRPSGFAIGDGQFHKVTTWRKMYQMVCQDLRRADPQRFTSLPGRADFTSRRGNALFMHNPAELRVALNVGGGLYTEGNLSALALCENMRRLLTYFGRDPMEVKIYLRPDAEDVDADDAESQAM